MTFLRNLLCSSFIAAWADLHETSFDRNKAAAACMTPLCWMSDAFRSKALDLHLHMQNAWKKCFRQPSGMTAAAASTKKWWQFWR
jgi:hypothetical protein